MSAVAVDVSLLLFIVCVFFGFLAVVWKLRVVEERLGLVEDDLAIDRLREIEATRAIGAITQREGDLAIIGLALGDDDDRVVVSEWTRPDYRDERIPEPFGKVVPW